MFAALLFVVTVLVPAESITAKNIEVGRVGTIAVLKVQRVGSNFIEARFDGIDVIVSEYPTKGIGVGKVLPDKQLWYVHAVVMGKVVRSDYEGWYVLMPAEKAPPKK